MSEFRLKLSKTTVCRCEIIVWFNAFQVSSTSDKQRGLSFLHEIHGNVIADQCPDSCLLHMTKSMCIAVQLRKFFFPQ